LTPRQFSALPDEEQAEMLGYTAWRSSLCKDCGVKADLARDPRTTFSLTDEICWGCRIREDKAAEMAKEAETAGVTSATRGVKVYISGARRNPAPDLKVVTDGE
jgi:hypothetical protein